MWISKLLVYLVTQPASCKCEIGPYVLGDSTLPLFIIIIINIIIIIIIIIIVIIIIIIIIIIMLIQFY